MRGECFYSSRLYAVPSRVTCQRRRQLELNMTRIWSAKKICASHKKQSWKSIEPFHSHYFISGDFLFFFSYKSPLTGNPVFPTLGRIKVIRVNTWLDVSGLKQHFNWSRIIQWYSNRSFPVCDVCFSGWFTRPWLIFQVSRSFSQSTCRRSLSSRLWATLCATEKESTPVATTSAFVSVPRTTHNATVQSQTSRLWRTPCWECPSCGLPRTKTLRALVRNVFTTTKTFESLWQYCSISLK